MLDWGLHNWAIILQAIFYMFFMNENVWYFEYKIKGPSIPSDQNVKYLKQQLINVITDSILKNY